MVMTHTVSAVRKMKMARQHIEEQRQVSMYDLKELFCYYIKVGVLNQKRRETTYTPWRESQRSDRVRDSTGQVMQPAEGATPLHSHETQSLTTGFKSLIHHTTKIGLKYIGKTLLANCRVSPCH